MPKSEAKILAGLKEAILTEQTGIQFYTVASRNTSDAQGREVFMRLASEEGLHRDYLTKLYQDIAGGKIPEPPKTGHWAYLDGDSPIFSRELKARIGEAHWEMTALAVGLQLEQATIERYRGLASESDIKAVSEFYEMLAGWEETHAAALERQSRYLREDYWHQARFAPF